MNGLRVVGSVLLVASLAWAQDYRMEQDRLVVDETHWQEWDFPSGTAQFSAEGVRPRFIQGRVNAVLDAETFVDPKGRTGGIGDAGTHLQQAGNIIDGREDTFWEPDPEAALEQWWVEIDLGRSAWARKVVVKFVEEGVGDPFLQFKLLTSSGLPAFSQSEALNYVIAGRSEGLNKTQRVFEFDLRPTVEADPDFPGDLIRFLQIVATASDRGQAEEIGEERWNSLPEAERGDVLYFRREATGVMRQVDRAAYEAIADAEQRGPVRHYRRERPRLAEVEVWTGGDNISLGALDRGGQIVGYGSLGAEVLTVDGNYNTFWSVEVGFSSLGFEGDLSGVVVQDPIRHVLFDLGAWYWVDRTLMVFDKQASGGAFPNYVINLSDGSRAPDGSLLYTSLAERGLTGGLQNDQNRSIFYQDNSFALTKARFFMLDYHIVNHSVRAGIREIQLYGRGFLPQMSLTSSMIELGRNPRILSTLTWDAETPPGTQMQIRTRTGNQIEQKIHYFNTSGVEVTEVQYRKLLSFQRGDSLITFIPGADWSHWSQFYQEPGAAITSPSPRRYVMVQATLLSEDPDEAVLLRDLSLNLDDPLASRLLGEMAPPKIQEKGQRQVFTLFLRPIYQTGSRGFNQVLIEVPPGAEVELVDVAVGSESELMAGGGQVYGGDELEQLASGPDSLWVRLPEPVDQQTPGLVALRFSGVLYLASNAFIASVGLGEGEERVWQRVDAGDAAPLAEGRGMTVLAPFGGGLLGQVEVAPNPFTPNGDGVNDLVEFTFPVFKIQGQKAMQLEVYTLEGRLVRRLEELAIHAAGLQRLVWDGRDDGGQLLPPGLYICRVGMEVDAENVERPLVAKLVSSVY